MKLQLGDAGAFAPVNLFVVQHRTTHVYFRRRVAPWLIVGLSDGPCTVRTCNRLCQGDCRLFDRVGSALVAALVAWVVLRRACTYLFVTRDAGYFLWARAGTCATAAAALLRNSGRGPTGGGEIQLGVTIRTSTKSGKKIEMRAKR